VPDDGWDLTPEEEARFFGSGRRSGVGCLLGVLIVTAVVLAFVFAVILLMDDVKSLVHNFGSLQVRLERAPTAS
jgi:hypothetical protein